MSLSFLLQAAVKEPIVNSSVRRLSGSGRFFSAQSPQNPPSWQERYSGVSCSGRPDYWLLVFAALTVTGGLAADQHYNSPSP